VLGATLAENKTWRARTCLARLATAALTEASAFGLDRGGERLRTSLQRLRNGNGHRPSAAAAPTPPQDRTPRPQA